MQFSEETLMAYVDGEVDADTRRQIDAAMALDPSIAERVAKHRSLRADLGAAFGGVLDEPVPEYLLQTANTAPAGLRSATVSDLSAARAAKQRGSQPKTSWSWPQWSAIAASLILGVLAGRTALKPEASDLFASTQDGIVAAGQLSAALNDQLGGGAGDDAVQIGLSFRSKSGEYCRSFTTAVSAGFACNEADQWKVRALSDGASKSDGGQYRMAGSTLPPAIVAAINDVMEGEALDSEQEQAARQRHWKE